MTKYEIIKNICESRGVSITATATKAGLSTALPPAWKNGRDIRYDQLAKMAKALDIPLQDFLYMVVTGETEVHNLSDTATTYTNEGKSTQPMIEYLQAEYANTENADEAEILNFYRSLSRKGAFVFGANKK